MCLTKSGNAIKGFIRCLTFAVLFSGLNGSEAYLAPLYGFQKLYSIIDSKKSGYNKERSKL